jgi:hypothetical protein
MQVQVASSGGFATLTERKILISGLLRRSSSQRREATTRHATLCAGRALRH